WRLRFETGQQPDITVAVRMDIQNQRALDYYLLPSIDIASEKLRLAEDNGLAVDCYRFDSLDVLFEFLRPTSIVEAA
ncbi:recombinase, partial [Bradyrhizobium sp. AS23.2]